MHVCSEFAGTGPQLLSFNESAFSRYDNWVTADDSTILQTTGWTGQL